jgi:FkbM family methyltransferase
MTFISYAQNFEDVMLWRALRHVENGFYIDVGAGHPDDYSVTRAFYDRGWRGINIEPSVQFYSRLAAARSRDVNLNVAVGPRVANVDFFEIPDSGLSTLDPAIAAMHRDADWVVEPKTIEQTTLAEICRKHAPADIHFLKIDTEGSEDAVLSSADFSSFRPWIVLAEATQPLSQEQNHEDWEPAVLSAGYRFAWFDGLNRFYIAAEHWERLSSAFAAPPNVFDDFIRATDTEHLNRIIRAEQRAAVAEARVIQASVRASDADRVAREAEARAAQAEARAHGAEACAAQAEARAQSAEARSLEARERAAQAEGQTAQAEARAVVSEARASAAEVRATTAETGLAEMAARHCAAVTEIAALRTSTSWRLTVPLRVMRWLFTAHIGAALMEAGIPQGRVERLKSSTVGKIRRTIRLNQVAKPVGLPRGAADREEISAATQNGVLLAKPEKQTAAASAAETSRRTVHQFHSGSAPGDAVTNSMLLMQRSLRSLGYASEIFVEHRHPQLADRLFEIDDLPEHDDYILIVHHSMGYDACERIISLPARKILMYHNITPPEFLSDFPEYIPYAELGRQQLSLLRPSITAALADSEFNALELRRYGYGSPIACPFLLDVGRLVATAPRRSFERNRSPFTVLFVGRVVASKGQADLVDAFAEFRRAWSAPCRLVLVGRMASPNATYPQEIRRRICHHGLQDAVLLTGLVSDEELSEWYQAADLYVSLSLHEGFGVPLIEAMAHGIPVLAWPAGAIPYTVGNGGELLHDRSPTAVATTMLRLAREPALREKIAGQQRKRLERFRLDRQMPRLIQALMKAGAAPPLEPSERKALSANLRFTITGHVLGSYSLAAINRWLALSLERRKSGSVRFVPWENGPAADLSAVPTTVAPPIVDLVARPEHVTGPEVVISQHYPIEMPSHRGDLTVAWLAWEESLLPIDFVRVLNKNFDAVFAPSTYVACVLINSGLSIPVRVVGQAPDLTHFRRLRTERKPSSFGAKRAFTFLHVSSCFPRKGVDVLLAAYAKAFRQSDPVRLVIKGFPNPHNDVSRQIEQLHERDPGIAEIIMINHDISETEMAELYRDADAVVLPTRGEGFNLPAAEAMAGGVPLIVTDHGGHLDFCTSDEVRLVRSSLVASRSHVASAGSVWAEPDPEDLCAALREAFEDIPRCGSEYAARALRAVEVIDKKLDPAAWAERISEAAIGLLTTPRALQLKIAWVSTWAVPCGIAEYSRSLIERLVSQPAAIYQSTVVLCDARTPMSTDIGGIRVCPSWRLGEASIERLARTISKEDPNIVVIQYHRGILPWNGLLKLLEDHRVSRRTTIVTLHAAQHLSELDPDERTAAVAALSHVSRVLVHRVSDLNLLKALGLVRNTALFPHGAQESVYIPPIRDLTESSAPVIGCHGFFLPGKGISRLLEAVARLRETWPHLRLRLVNAEYPVLQSASEIVRCHELADSLSLAEVVEWDTTFQSADECLRALSTCDLLVLPYDPSEESASGALRRALSSGVPTAVTPISIFDEANEAVHRLPGLDTASVVAGIDTLLRDAPARAKLQSSALAWLLEHDWGGLAERMLGMMAGLRAAQSQPIACGRRPTKLPADRCNP